MTPFERRVIQLRKNLATSADILEKSLATVLDEEKELQKFLIEDQLQRGLNAAGEKMPKYKPGKYGDRKKARNPKNGGRWDLKNKGDYLESIEVKVSKKLVKYDATDKKHEFLKKTNPLGLTKESKKEILRIARPRLRKDLRQHLRK